MVQVNIPGNSGREKPRTTDLMAEAGREVDGIEDVCMGIEVTRDLRIMGEI